MTRKRSKTPAHITLTLGKQIPTLPNFAFACLLATCPDQLTKSCREGDPSSPVILIRSERLSVSLCEIVTAKPQFVFNYSHNLQTCKHAMTHCHQELPINNSKLVSMLKVTIHLVPCLPPCTPSEWAFKLLFCLQMKQSAGGRKLNGDRDFFVLLNCCSTLITAAVILCLGDIILCF